MALLFYLSKGPNRLLIHWSQPQTWEGCWWWSLLPDLRHPGCIWGHMHWEGLVLEHWGWCHGIGQQRLCHHTLLEWFYGQFFPDCPHPFSDSQTIASLFRGQKIQGRKYGFTWNEVCGWPPKDSCPPRLHPSKIQNPHRSSLLPNPFSLIASSHPHSAFFPWRCIGNILIVVLVKRNHSVAHTSNVSMAH